MKKPNSSKKTPFDMSIKHKTPYPTVGEIVQFVLKGTGLWEGFEDDKKTIQKTLQRFASEEIILTKEEINEIFENSLQRFFASDKLRYVLADFAVGMIYGYPLLLKENTGLFDREKTGLWELSVSLPAPLVIYVKESMKLAKHPSVIKSLDGVFPDLSLFLPDYKENKWEYPCQKVLGWWLKEVLKTSPEKLILKVNIADKNKRGVTPDPRTVRKWLNGEETPGMSYLVDLTKYFSEDDSGRKKETFLFYMIIARLSEFFFKSMLNTYSNVDIEKAVKNFLILFKSFEETVEPTLSLKFKFIEKQPFEIWKQEIQIVYETILPEVLEESRKAAISDNAFFTKAASLYNENKRFVELPEDTQKFIDKTNEVLESMPGIGRYNENFELFKNTVSYMADTSPKDGSMDFMVSFLKARIKIVENNLQGAFDNYINAFNKGRNSAGNFRERIVRETLGLCAYQFTLLHEKKGPKEKYWKVLTYLRKWAKLYYTAQDIISDNDREFLELSRRRFQDIFRKHLPNIEAVPIRIGEWDSVAGPETIKKMEKWKPDFKRPSRLVKEFESRDNSQVMVAIGLKRKDDALKLIEMGADLNFINTTNDNAFNYAMSSFQYDIALKILEGNISLETLETPSKRFGTTGFGLVISQRKPELVKKLLEKGIDVNKRLPEMTSNITPLYLAVTAYGQPPWEVFKEDTPNNRMRLMQIQRSIKCPVEHSYDQYGRHLEIFNMVAEVHKAFYGSDEESLEIIKILLEAGAVLDIPNTNQHSALTFACELGLKDVVELLLKYKAYPDHRINNGATALMFAVEKDFTEIAELLLKNGADPTITRDDGAMPLDFCKSEKMQALIIEGIRNYKPQKGIIINSAKA